MKALRFYQQRTVRLETVPMPTIETVDDVIVRIKAAGICGSDVSRYAKLGPHQAGITFGHEGGGVVVARGTNVTAIEVGDHVAICPSQPCQTCQACLRGQYSQCDQMLVLGAQLPGVFADYVCVPQKMLIPIPQTMPFDELAFVEPTAVVLHGLLKTELRPGSTVAVIGCGTIGLLAIQWARIFGAKMIHAFDIDQMKLQLATTVGAHQTYQSQEATTTLAAFQQQTNTAGVDLVIEASGSPVATEQAFAYAKRGGELLLLGIPYADVTLHRSFFEKIMRHELTIKGSWHSMSAPFPGQAYHTSIHFLNRQQLKVAPLITHRIGLSDLPAMFERIVSDKEIVGKVIIYPE
ncbi:galactitol-1-phosphate 5-dehydrogenase [Brochothrix campestris]|uniref:Alcohol dehydrogenase GroES n=1 Tax=Brochothrix campestris FSL F6-1037 TaxID=1265861 RepID=W7D240_9LIST|nr:galactitol-1-phosphate 5-dehydrogenase [Brochothrix campestris]EUJ39343.1 alcohol dehydrogenase GroES [Brochothrix campestris FSL F6-1037]